MKAWYLLGPRELELREIPEPEPGPEEALVRVRAVGICGSDAECFAGRHPLPNYPRLPGHEFSGEVAAVGASWSGAPVGTRVAVDPALSCGRCYACRQGRHNCCSSVSIAGVHRTGAMTEYVLCAADQLVSIPDTMSFEAAAVVETLSIGAQAVGRGDVREGDRVVVLGAGPIGLCCLIMARRRGASVLASEPLPWRRDLARQIGAEVCVDPIGESVTDAVRDFTDAGGANVVIDATGELAGARLALTLVGQAARVVILSLCKEPLEIPPWDLVRQELTVLGSRLTLADFGDLVAIAGSGEVPLNALVTHRLGFAEVERAFAAACERPPGLVKAVVVPDS